MLRKTIALACSHSAFHNPLQLVLCGLHSRAVRPAKQLRLAGEYPLQPHAAAGN